MTPAAAGHIVSVLEKSQTTLGSHISVNTRLVLLDSLEPYSGVSGNIFPIRRTGNRRKETVHDQVFRPFSDRLMFTVVFAALPLSWTTMATGGKFPATGQTTCWDNAGAVIPCDGTGQDGDIRAGARLRYKDNGDGTVTDKNTNLTWEKLSADGSIHDRSNSYSWADAFAVHVAGLNE